MKEYTKIRAKNKAALLVAQMKKTGYPLLFVTVLDYDDSHRFVEAFLESEKGNRTEIPEVLSDALLETDEFPFDVEPEHVECSEIPYGAATDDDEEGSYE